MFNSLYNRRRTLIDNNLRDLLLRSNSIDNTLRDSMLYSLSAGGKRIRPILLIATADALDVDGENFLNVASSLELIHTYSLIHDDLPSMDNDDFRRGKPSNHKVFGDAIAILAGDALLTLAFEIISRQNNVPPHILLRVINEIASAAGPAGMVGGQAIDLRSNNIDLHTLKFMYSAKTGALFKAAVRSGAILANASPDQFAALTNYADYFGLAFQITDDILDAVSDSLNNKSTFVSLTSLDHANQLAKVAVQNAIDAIAHFNSNADFLRQLVLSLANRSF